LRQSAQASRESTVSHTTEHGPEAYAAVMVMPSSARSNSPTCAEDACGPTQVKM